MNILPKKRWHVRTKENIARVRRDEAKAAEEEKQKKNSILKAESEARINFLRNQARIKYDGRDAPTSSHSESSTSEKQQHINIFSDLEEGRLSSSHGHTNKEHDKEIKEEKEKYEKQIGYLTYLGQDTNEATGKVNWYNELPERLRQDDKCTEVQQKKKILHDPLTLIKRAKAKFHNSEVASTSSAETLLSGKTQDNKYKSILHQVKEKKKMKKKHKKDKRQHSAVVDLEKLRQQRLLREQVEKSRTEALLAKLRGELPPVVKTESKSIVHQKYNNQFFPEYARQNQIFSKR